MADRATPLRAQVISVVSHELRTPLTTIASLIGLVEDGSLDARDRGEAVTAIRRNTERMLTLVDDLNLLAALETFAPGGGAVEVAALVRAVAPAGVRVAVPDGPPVGGDPELLEELMRLVLGAVSAVAADGTVSVSGEYGAQGWILRARGYATGLGTTEGMLTAGTADPDQPYRRSVGLSVLLAQAIATGHGGGVSVEHEADGQATVTVTLPA